MTPVSTPIIMATILQFCNRGRSHSFPELSKTRNQQDQPEDNGTETPKRMRSPQEEISSKRLQVTMESIVSKEEAEKALTLCVGWVRRVDNAELPHPTTGEKSQQKNINLFLRAYLGNHT